jgi:hypothetical protein
MSSNSSGSSYQGVNIAIAGLSFQVFSLIVFICLAADYAIKYWRGHKAKITLDGRLTRQFKTLWVSWLSPFFASWLDVCIGLMS